MDYRFLLGRAFRIQEKTYVVSALGKVDGVEIVRAAARGDGEQAMQVFPAATVIDHLQCDEEIELAPVLFA